MENTESADEQGTTASAASRRSGDLSRPAGEVRRIKERTLKKGVSWKPGLAERKSEEGRPNRGRKIQKTGEL